jgi:hypothetical protein
VIERARAVIQGGSAGSQLRQPLGIGGIRGDPLDRRVLGPAAAPADHADVLAPLGQQ